MTPVLHMSTDCRRPDKTDKRGARGFSRGAGDGGDGGGGVALQGAV